MEILVIGCGAIGTVVARAARDMDHVGDVMLYDVDPKRAEACARSTGGRIVALDDGIAEADLVIEAASQDALRALGPVVLAAGCDLVVMSVGALLDETTLRALKRGAEKSGAKIYLPSGAIGGLDALRAASVAGIEMLTLTSAKPPDSLGLGNEEIHDSVVLFEGDAKEAVRRFPKNVNVAAAIALAAGKAPRVRVVADPSLRRNTHTIEASGPFGRFVLRFENEPFPENPATSYLAALAAVALVRGLGESTRFG
ncbi:MAG: aspartate dehydrogenase [Thermoplasmatota archaeon]